MIPRFRLAPPARGGARTAAVRPCVGALALLIALVVIITWNAPARAESERCQRAIAKASAKFTRAKMKALRKCEQAVVAGTTHDSCPNERAQERIAQAQDQLQLDIHNACSGDPSCQPGASRAAIGWDIPGCPDLNGSGCTNPISSCDDVVTCLACAGGSAADQAKEIIYGEMNLSNDAQAVVDCQSAIGENVTRLFDVRLRGLQKCEDRILSGVSTGPCPDAKIDIAITRAVTKATSRICGACGGPDFACGGGDDLTRLDIGFPTTCPDVTVPGGTACGGPVNDLQDIVNCLTCVTQYTTSCMDRLGVLGLASYPADCE
jgi:hypothetical protein